MNYSQISTNPTTTSNGNTDILNKVQELEALAPQLSRAINKTGFEIGANSIIGDREWALTTFAMLLAMGDMGNQLEVYLSAAVKSGATDDEILDIINMASIYTGAPRAVNAARQIASALSRFHSRWHN